MAIEIITGKIGSGKSVLLNKRMISMAMNGRDLALNFEPNDHGLYQALRKRGMPHYRAREVIKKMIIIRTYEQLRDLRNRWLGFDESHFWFNARMWDRITPEDVQFWSLSRKYGVDVSCVTQRAQALDATVRELAVRHWHAQPLVSKEESVFPFNLAVMLNNRLRVSEKILGMFRYTLMESTLGSTADARKGIAGAVSSQSIVVLTESEGKAYDTGKFFTSPLILEVARERRVEYLKKVYLGELIPLQTCTTCNGLGYAYFRFSSTDAVYTLDDRCEITDPLAVHRECSVCGGTGYYSEASSADLQEAKQAALSGLLGPDLKAAALQSEQTGMPPVVAKKRGGWAAKNAR